MKHNELHELLIPHTRFSYKHNTAKQIRTSKAGVTKSPDGVNEHLSLDQRQTKSCLKNRAWPRSQPIFTSDMTKKMTRYALC